MDKECSREQQVLFPTMTFSNLLCSHHEHVSSPSSVNGAVAVVDLTTLSPLQQTGWRLFFFDAVDTCVSDDVDILTLFAVAGPFCTGRGGATREMEG